MRRGQGRKKRCGEGQGGHREEREEGMGGGKQGGGRKGRGSEEGELPEGGTLQVALS